MTAFASLPQPSSGSRRRGRRALRAAGLAVAAAAVLLAGVWVAGGVVTDDFHLAMGLTTAWMLLAGAAALAMVRSRPRVGLPVLAGYAAAATAAGLYLGYTTLNDREVDEAVAMGTPASAMPAPASADVEAPPRVNVEEAAGTFRSGEHTTSGTARIVRLRDGGHVLTLTGFSTSAGPDLRVRVVPGAGTDGAAEGAVDLGALKGNRGDQQYRLPEGLRPRRDTVVIWCRAFSALFGSAQLRPS